MADQKHYLGIDIGSTTFKAVLMSEDGKVEHSTYQRTKPMESARVTCISKCSACGHCNLGALKKTVDAFLAEAGVSMDDIRCTVVTGSQIVDGMKRFINYDFQVSEVSAHVAGALHFHPHVRAILDVGGQDSKAMIYNEKMGMWTSKMSGICAAGTGAFLDSVALKLGIPVEEMADKADYSSELEFSSVCAVLSAPSINKFNNRMPLGQVVGGACRAQARTIISGVGQLLFNYKGDIVFQGGVASNPMKKPFRIAFAVQDHSLNVLVKISTDEGLWGIGEAAPFEPVTGESAATVLKALKLFRTGLIGMDPLDVEGIHRMMDRLLSGNTSAKAAVDIALYDIKGKLMGQPLYKVLGGSVNQIVTDMTVGIDTPEAMAAEARERVEKDGFTILKIKAGINPIEDIQALTLIRQAVGPNIRLRVDANQGYTVSDAVRTLKAFEELGVEAVEQCLPSWDLDGMRFVRSKVDLKVMLDESVHTPIDAAKACKIDAADIINIKLMKCGGLYPAEKINAIAEANHVQCMVGCMLETKVAIAAGVGLVAAKQNITEADCDSFMYAVDPEMGMPGGFAVNGGVYTLSDKPGLGIDIDF